MRFSPGEIAILCNLTGEQAVYNGAEVTIVKTCCQSECYRVAGAAFGQACVHHTELRRRPPPLDWSAIAGIKDKPREVEPA